MQEHQQKYKYSLIFAKLGFYNLYRIITLLTILLALSIIIFSIIFVLFGAWLTSLQMLMLSLLISFAVLKLTNYINDLKFDAKGLKDNAFYLSVAGLIFLLNFMPIITLLDKVIVTIAVLAVVGSFIDNHPKQKDKTFTSLVKFLVVATNTIVCSILLGWGFPNAAFVFVGFLSAVFSVFCLKGYLYADIKDKDISSKPFAKKKEKDDGGVSEKGAFSNSQEMAKLFKFVDFLISVVWIVILLQLLLPNLSVVGGVIISGIISLYFLKDYLFDNNEKTYSDYDKQDLQAKVVNADDKKLEYMANVFNSFSIIYELFFLLYMPVVSFIAGSYSLLTFIGFLILAGCACIDTFNFSALLGSNPKKLEKKSSLIRESIGLLGNDVSDFFKKISTWYLILDKFAMPGYVRLGLVGLCVAISLLASISKQLASINKKLTSGLREAILTAEGNRAKRSKCITYILFVMSVGLWFAGFFNVIWFALSVVSVVCLIIDEYQYKGVLKASIASFTLCSVIAAHGYAIHLLCSYFGVFGYLVNGIIPISLLLGLGVALLLNQDLIKQKSYSLKNCEFEKKAPWVFAMLKNITGCFKTLLPYFGISNSAIMMLFMTCSPWVKLMLAFVCGVSSLFEGYLFLTHVLFVVDSTSPKQSDFRLEFGFYVFALVILLFMKSAFYYVAIFGLIISVIDYNKLVNKGFRDIVKFLAVGLNFVLVFLVCKTLLSLYVTATIVEGSIALSSVISLILTAVLNFYYAKNQLGSMQTNLAKILLARCSGLLLFVSFLFRCGGTYCMVILALNKIPFIVAGSIVYNVLALIISVSCVAPYVANISRSYIKQEVSIMKIDSQEQRADAVNSEVKMDRPVDGWNDWIFHSDERGCAKQK
jgi:hypothetical protein